MIKNIYNLLELKLKRKLWILLLLTLASTAFELLSVGLIIPAISFLVESDISEKYPQLIPILNFFGNPSQKYIVSFGMVFLAFIYLLKSSFLTYLIFWQNRFANEFQVRTAERLFTKYIKHSVSVSLRSISKTFSLLLFLNFVTNSSILYKGVFQFNRTKIIKKNYLYL